METYKGTDKDMKCHGGYQYTLGKKNTDDGAIRCGSKGFHSCEAPMDVLRYFPLRDGNRYFESNADGSIDCEDADDSKIASSELTIKAEIGLPGIIKAHMEYTRKKAAAGTSGGYRSNLAGGDNSNLAGGDRSLIIGRNGCNAKGGKNAVIVLTEWGHADNQYKPTCVKAVIVDGETIKADTWYKLVDGEIVEA
ncbi:MAG: hypothetical protein GXW99_05290 [Clostridiales bacterium]|nr:hypothetical protein [Clostridiales bacterium]